MFRHIVFIKFIDQQSSCEIKQMLEELKGKISQIHELEVGIDEFCSERSYDLVLLTTFANESDYHIYDTHPDHSIVKKRIQELKKSVCAVDYHI